METLSRIIGNHVRLFRDGAATADVAHAASRARTTNVATIVTAIAHGFTTGDTVTTTLFGGAAYTAVGKVITVVNATTFPYASVGDDEETAVDTDGVITRTGVASRTKRPSPTDAGWLDVGIVMDLGFDRTGTSDQIFAPNPGKIELYDVIETKMVNGVKFTTEQLGVTVYEVLFASAALTPTSTDYTPNAKLGKKFWVEVLQYDQDDSLVNTVYLYCYVKINGEVKFSDKHVTANFDCQKLVSALNKGTLVTSA